MKSTNKHIHAFLLAVIYSFAMFASTHVYHSSVYQDTYSAEKDTYSVYTAGVSFAHTPQVELSFDASDSRILLDVENVIGSHSISSYNNTVLCEAFYKQYIDSGVGFFVHQRKADIIFPFHYHW